MPLEPFNIGPTPKQLAENERIYEACKSNLISFGKLFLHGDFGRSETPDFHKEIGHAYLNLERINKNLAVVIARGHGKTTLCKAYIMHRCLFHDPTQMPLFIGWCADTGPKAFNNLEYIRDNIEANERIRYYFGDLRGDRVGKKWNEKYLTLSNGCTLISRSNAVSLRGETKGGKMGSRRYTDVILDDIENEENTRTLESRTRLKRVVTDSILNATDLYEGRLVFNGTPVHPDSLCQTLLNGWRKAMKENTTEDFTWHVITYGATQPSMPEGVLWPGYWSLAKLKQKKQSFIDIHGHARGYYQEYELMPQDTETLIWSRDSYRIHDATYYWDSVLRQSFIRIDGEPIPVNCFLGCDPATDIETRISDNSVIMVIAVDKHNRIFVLDYISKKSIPQMAIRDENRNVLTDLGVVDYIFSMYEDYHCINATVEDVGMTRGVWQDIEAEQMRRERNGLFYDMDFLPIEPGGKEKRNKIKTGLNRFFAYKQIHVRDEHWTLREQIEQFGPTLVHDDEIETLFFATRNMEPPGIEKTLHSWKRPQRRKRRKWTTA